MAASIGAARSASSPAPSAGEGDHGELEAFRRSWCTYDWAFNDLLAGGQGAYRRPHTLSHGDDRCDMRWAVDETGSGTAVTLRSRM